MHKKHGKISVIDLFSGPGGLGEGFSSYEQNGKNPFKIAISIEKEESAHATLTLRAFYRQFDRDNVPNEYYSFLKGNLGTKPEMGLYQTKSLISQVKAAELEARCLELGKDNIEIDRCINEALKASDDCILIGGPPCQAYSLVGRSRRKGLAGYVAEKDNRNYLYKEYLRILGKYNPAVFVMENVKGMLSAKVDDKPVFGRIIEDLRNPEHSVKKYKIYSLVTNGIDAELFEDRYQAEDFIIRMELYGIPQARHRVILLGIREDIAAKHNNINLLHKSNESISLNKVIGSLPALRSGISKDFDSAETWHKAIASFRKSDINSTISISTKLFKNEISSAIEESRNHINRGNNFSVVKTKPNLFKNMPLDLRNWYADPKDPYLVCNHETRGHMKSDLHRYLFCATWAKVANEIGSSIKFPRPEDYPRALKPAHKSFNTGTFSDRFRVQITDTCATTVTSHISKDGHYFIHYDPSQCRSLTVREAARIQTFPDNYFFLGNRTQQYVQVGNAVPPLLANKIAGIVLMLL
jgi:DNA (cytosine-5)-methyltransferase 1